MKVPVLFTAFILASSLYAATAGGPTGFPFTDEDLNYSVNWPSGLSLGDAHLHARHSGNEWNLSFSITAGVPGYNVNDSYKASAVSDLCSVLFERDTLHGTHTAKERETIDRDRALATRTTLLKDGGKSDFPVPPCAKDALTYLFYARRELGQGRVPGAQKILIGSLHEIRLDYAGPQMITADGKQVQSDKVICTVTTATAQYKFDTYFARDPARTLLLVTVPLSMGSFSMELVH
jgi:hypothetical protein